MNLLNKNNKQGNSGIKEIYDEWNKGHFKFILSTIFY
jgi:hypothetical protein